MRAMAVVAYDEPLREIDPVLAAPMSCALGTAYRSVVTRGGVRAGSRVAVLGLGGVGIPAAQVARAAGAVVVGFDLHHATLDAADELGLDARRADDPEAEEDMRAAAGGRGVDVVIDTVGHDDTVAQADRLVRAGGRIVGVGYSPASSYGLPSPRLVLGEIEVVGSRYAHRDDLEHAIALTAGDVVGRAVIDIAGVTERVGS